MKRLLILLLVFAPVVGSRARCLESVSRIRNASGSEYMAPVWADSTSHQPYITAGDRAFCIGLQDGSFPPMGWHQRDEMGGLWAGAIKLADGFSLSVGSCSSPLRADAYATLPYGNLFRYGDLPDGGSIERLQWAPQGIPALVVGYRLSNPGKQPLALKLRFAVRFELMESWLYQAKGVRDGQDALADSADEGCLLCQDAVNPWMAVCVASIPATAVPGEKGELDSPGSGCTGALVSEIIIPPGEDREIRYVICGGAVAEGAADYRALSRSILDKYDVLLQAKKDYYADLLNLSGISIPDKAVQDAYHYAKINDAWLISYYDARRYLGAGAIDYPWLFGCDNSYALQGVVAAGGHELAEETLSLLADISEQESGDGRVIHEMSSSGVVYNPGNTQEAAHFIVAVTEVLRWTGDLEWVRGLYPFLCKSIEWLLESADKDGDMLPEGPGIMEAEGEDGEMLDSAVYTLAALRDLAWISSLLEQHEQAKRLQDKAARLSPRIEQYYWDEAESLYRDSALQTEPTSEEGYSRCRFWIGSVPMEMGLAPYEHALPALDKVRRERCSAWGPCVSTVGRPFYMTIATGVQAEAEARYGRIDEAMDYLRMIASTLHVRLPGAMSEIMPGEGCPVQAWTIYGPACVLIRHIFGISPDATSGSVTISPHLPSGWDRCSIGHVRVGESVFSLQIHRTRRGIVKCRFQHLSGPRLKVTIITS